MRKVTHQVLSNGMDLYSQYDSGGTTHLGGVGVRTGSILDPENHRGVSHLGEHVLSAVSHKYSARRVWKIIYTVFGGPGKANVFIDKTSTFFGSPDLRSHRDLLLVLDLFASLLKDRLITSSRIAIEKSVIHQEFYLEGTDKTEMVLEDLLHQIIYKKNPARIRVDGHLEDIKLMTPHHVRSVVKRFFVPKNMFVVILGPKPQEARRIAEKFFGDLPGQTKPIIEHENGDTCPQLTKIESIEISKGVHQHYVAIGFPVAPFSSPDAPALEIIAKILGFEAIMELREGNTDFTKGVYRVPCILEMTSVHGLLYIWFATTSPDYARYGEQAIIQKCYKLCTHLISEQDFQHFRYAAMNDYYTAFQDSALDLCNLIVASACNGDRRLVWLNNFRESFRAVTRESLRRVARKYLSGNYGRVVIRPP